MSYWRQRKIVELHKKMVGQTSKDIPDEIIQLDENIKKIKGELAALRARGAPEAKLAQVAAQLTPLEYRYRQLLISLKLME